MRNKGWILFNLIVTLLALLCCLIVNKIDDKSELLEAKAIEVETIVTIAVEPETEPITVSIETVPFTSLVEAVSTTDFYTEEEVTILAKLIYGEARGIESKTEQACIVWTVLNRVDLTGKTIKEIVTSPDQFHYLSTFPTINDYGHDLKALAADVLDRWALEKLGEVDVGRVLPQTYLYFSGHHGHNWFREKIDYSDDWDYSLHSPYEN